MFNWLIFSLGSQLVIGTSAVFDKLLLKRKFFDPWVYTFWFGLLGIFALALVPFGFALVPLKIFFLTFIAGGAFVVAAFLLYSGLLVAEASETLPIIGGLSSIFTLTLAAVLLKGSLDLGQMVGFFFLASAAFAIFLVERKGGRPSLLGHATGSAFFLSVYFVLAKIAFEETSFVPAFIWLKLGSVIVVLALLLVPSLRRRVFSETRSTEVSNRFFYFLNRGYAGLGSLLFIYAISLAHPALVDATQSFKYIIIFLASWLLLRERFRGLVLAGKILALLLVILGIILLGSVEYARTIPINKERPINWGVSFSHKFSKRLGLDWQDNFVSILNDLKPKKIRLIAYWDDIEKRPGEYHFSGLDWQLDKAGKAEARVILALGLKTPRWPECHIPDWAKELSPEKREEALRDYFKVLIERYKNNSAIQIWQIENEPYLAFGKCPARGKAFLEKEIALLKSIDSSRPVLVTDGGEFGLWYKAARAGDIFGTTMYREAYPRLIGPIFGPVDYHIDPVFFPLKERVVRYLIADQSKKFVVIELQAEPWGAVEIPELSYEEQINLFSPDYFRGTIEYAKATGFEDYYLWGAEWWYLLKMRYNDPRFWEIARGLIALSK